MKVLVIGGGGREHALVWKIKASAKVKEVFCAPGNAGIAQIATCVPLAADDVDALIAFVEKENIDLTVVGPEVPLIKGIVDRLQEKKRAVFGPGMAAAELEGSKTFAKDIMKKYHIPTADYEVFDCEEKALAYLETRDFPLVIKADGLAAGKGVIIAENKKDAQDCIHDILGAKIFGDAGSQIVIEEFLQGEETSVLALTDGKTVLPLVSAQDHKRIFDGDKGPNTGGMGAYSPAPVYTEKVAQESFDKILKPMVAAMEAEGRPYQGVLYAGLMITAQGPKVLEFNARFGDPETQPILMRLKTDLIDIMEAVIEKRLDRQQIVWDERAAVCVIASAGGYPGKYNKGDAIKGLENKDAADLMVFHAGTKKEDDKILTNGGRVLGVTAMGEDIREAVNNAYKNMDKIYFKDMFYRKDIGAKALNRG